MKSTARPGVVTTGAAVILAFDVSRDTLNVHTEIGGRRLDRVITNRTLAIEAGLRSLAARARDAGADRVLVVCEASGRYQDTLMRTARALGLETAWVNGEAVAKMRVVESNDTGKTDIRDPRVIHTLASMGKTLNHRILEEPYALLREWHRIYEAAQEGMVQSKGAIHQQLKSLFPDYDLKKDFTFGPSGRALIERFGANPHRIVAVGQARFARTMKRLVPRIQKRTLERIWDQALSSLRHGITARHADAIEQRLRQLWDDHERYHARKMEARGTLETLYREARESDPHLPAERKGVINAVHLARIIAETGPLSDFDSVRKITRFAGLNLRERQSGTYRGQTRISKKGRPALRSVLNQIVLPLVKRNALFGSYYHQKRTRMPGPKAMACIARKFLKMLFGWYRSGQAFQPERVFTCDSQFRQAA